MEAGLAADKFEVGWVVADGTDNKFPDDGGPESNPAGSGLFWNRLVVVVTVWKRLSLNGCGLVVIERGFEKVFSYFLGCIFIGLVNIFTRGSFF